MIALGSAVNKFSLKRCSCKGEELTVTPGLMLQLSQPFPPPSCVKVIRDSPKPSRQLDRRDCFSLNSCKFIHLQYIQPPKPAQSVPLWGEGGINTSGLELWQKQESYCKLVNNGTAAVWMTQRQQLNQKWTTRKFIIKGRAESSTKDCFLLLTGITGWGWSASSVTPHTNRKPPFWKWQTGSVSDSCLFFPFPEKRKRNLIFKPTYELIIQLHPCFTLIF